MAPAWHRRITAGTPGGCSGVAVMVATFLASIRDDGEAQSGAQTQYRSVIDLSRG